MIDLKLPWEMGYVNRREAILDAEGEVVCEVPDGYADYILEAVDLLEEKRAAKAEREDI